MKRYLTANVVRELLTYDPITGVLTWNDRDRKWFRNVQSQRRFNAHFAGLRAGSVRCDGYRYMWILGNQCRSGRLIWLWMTDFWPFQFIDHKNRDRSDDRWCNLRDVSRLVNNRNRGDERLRVNNVSGVKGIHQRSENCWCARTRINGKRILIGHFRTLAEATTALDRNRRDV